MTNFYDKVAKKFGGYAYGSNNPKYVSKYESQDPEKVFKDKLLALGGKSKVVLDIGCGDGKFTLGIADSFKKITGIDNSVELLVIANTKQKEQNSVNTRFLLQNAKKTTFKDKSFDIIYNRRGPSFYTEYYRILKKGGNYLEIGIGERDTMELKKIFGRGQNFGQWNNPRLQKDKKEFKKLRFTVKMAKDYYYTEYYQSSQEFDNFLEGVPIFEDYETDEDRKYFEEYVIKFKTKEGIALKRHRVVYDLVK